MALNIKKTTAPEILAGGPSERKVLLQYLEQTVWPFVQSAELGRAMSREEEDQILGYGSEGY
jgi:hypothetical protein